MQVLECECECQNWRQKNSHHPFSFAGSLCSVLTRVSRPSELAAISALTALIWEQHCRSTLLPMEGGPRGQVIIVRPSEWPTLLHSIWCLDRARGLLYIYNSTLHTQGDSKNPGWELWNCESPGHLRFHYLTDMIQFLVLKVFFINWSTCIYLQTLFKYAYN